MGWFGVMFVEAIPIAETFGSNVEAIAKGPQGDLWIGLGNGSLSHWKDGQFTAFSHAKPFQRGIRRLIVTRDGLVLVVTSSGLSAYTPSRQQLLDRDGGLPCNEIFAVHQNREGDLWLYAECGLTPERVAQGARLSLSRAGSPAARARLTCGSSP